MTPFTNGDSNFPTWGENGRAETLLLEWVWGRGRGHQKKGLLNYNWEMCNLLGEFLHVFISFIFLTVLE